MAYANQQPVYVTNQPMAGNPFDQLNGQWTVGLCSCCENVSQCCYAYWCWWCFLGSLAGKIEEPTLSCCCVPNALAVYRMKVRSVLRIQGDSCKDYCTTFCCPLCAALQMTNELTIRNIA